MATAGRRVSESESSEGSSSSSSNDSLLTDTGQLSLQPYMHEPPATSSTYRRKVDESASQHTMGLAIADSLNSDSVDERHQHWFVTFHFVHAWFLMFHKHVHAYNCLADNISI